MTEPTEAQIKGACDLLDDAIAGVEADMADDANDAEETGERVDLYEYAVEIPLEHVKALRLAIAQRDTERAEHEAAMQRVSEFAKRVKSVAEYHGVGGRLRETAETFIQPDPTPTPEQVLREAAAAAATNRSCEEYFATVIAELAKRGHHVAPIKDTRHD